MSEASYYRTTLLRSFPIVGYDIQIQSRLAPYAAAIQIRWVEICDRIWENPPYGIFSEN